MMNRNTCFVILVFLLNCCGAKENGSDATTTKIALKSDAAHYVEDAEQNDNLSLLSTECDVSQSQPKIQLWYSSEALGSGYFVQSSVTLPASDAWTDTKYSKIDTTAECNAPGYRAVNASDLASAKTNVISNQKFLYGCGSTCDFELKSKQLQTDGKFKTLEVSWSCKNVGINSLVQDGKIFGSAIDKQIGSVICQ